MTSITIPDSVTSLGDYAFDGSQTVYYKGSVDEWFDRFMNNVNCSVYYYSETQPSSDYGVYWHYVDGKVTVW